MYFWTPKSVDWVVHTHHGVFLSSVGGIYYHHHHHPRRSLVFPRAVVPFHFLSPLHNKGGY